MFQSTGSHIQAVHILENNSFIVWQHTVFGDRNHDLYIMQINVYCTKSY
jgi:hypothetical protein